jgi:hypothetical protein
MDRHERRRRKRLEAKLERKIRGKETSQLPADHKESPLLQQRGLRALLNTASIAKILWSLVLAGLALLGGYGLVRPSVSVDPNLLLNPGDPFSTQFSVTNENVLFDVHDLHPSCRTIQVITSNNVGLLGLPPRPSPAIALLSARQKSTINCPPWIGGLGAGSGNVLTAYIAIDVSYKQDWWPSEKGQTFPFKGVIDSQKGVHWTHITLPELQAALSN